MRHAPVLLGAAIAANLAMPAHAAAYGPGRWTRIDNVYASAVVAGDVNWDKLDDLVVLSHDTGAGIDTVRIYLQQADGTLRYDTGTWTYTHLAFAPSLVLADLDNNGEPEILTGVATGALEIKYDYAGGHPVPVAIDNPVACQHVAAGDLDGDHYAELVCQSESAGATVWHNAGNGTFSESAPVATDAVAGTVISLADLTGDGKLDLLTSSPAAHGFAVYPHTIGWSFGAATRYGAPSGAPISTSTIGDLNRDGKPEALIASNGTAPYAAIWSYGTAGNGALATPVQFATHDGPVGVLARDLDRDGRDDLVVGTSDGGIGVQLNGGAYAQLGGTSPFAGDSNGLAAGDLDNDGCTDIAFTTPGGSVAIAYGSNCVRAVVHSDFDGDRHSDLVWHNTATGASTIWKAADSARTISVMRVTDPAWFIAGTGDFNGDGYADLLWRNNGTGAQVLWYSGSSSLQKSLTRITDLNWKIVGVGDFDGDGRADVLWRHATTGRNAIWRSGDSATPIAVTAVTNTQWVVAGIGDFDADGKDDILWRNPATSVNAIWRAGNASLPMSVAPNPDPNATVWVGDFNADRYADLLWANANGQYSLWFKANAAIARPMPSVSKDWRVVGIGDFDGNGAADVAWRNTRTGQDAIWRSASSYAPRAVSTVTDLNWVIVR